MHFSAIANLEHTFVRNELAGAPGITKGDLSLVTESGTKHPNHID